MFSPRTLKTLPTVAVGSAIATLGFADASRAAALYTVTRLDVGYWFSIANDINENGVVTGTSVPSAAFTREGFRWSADTGIERLPGSNNLFRTFGNGINDAGIVAGASDNYGQQSIATVWDMNGVPQLLPSLEETNPQTGLRPYDSANDINNRGQVVGSASSDRGYRAVLWENNQIFDLGIGSEATATAINESSWIVGNTLNNSFQNTGAFLWKNGQITNLDGFIEANDINDRGQVAGTSTCGSSTCASIWDNGSLTQLGSDTIANGINNLGWVVGSTARNTSLPQRALLWKNGEAIDLNTLLAPSNLDVRLTQATAINDKGQIVGTGYFAGGPWPPSNYAFVLTPVEEPTSVPESSLLFALGALGAGFAFSRRARS